MCIQRAHESGVHGGDAHKDGALALCDRLVDVVGVKVGVEFGGAALDEGAMDADAQAMDVE